MMCLKFKIMWNPNHTNRIQEDTSWQLFWRSVTSQRPLDLVECVSIFLHHQEKSPQEIILANLTSQNTSKLKNIEKTPSRFLIKHPYPERNVFIGWPFPITSHFFPPTRLGAPWKFFWRFRTSQRPLERIKKIHRTKQRNVKDLLVQSFEVNLVECVVFLLQYQEKPPHEIILVVSNISKDFKFKTYREDA